MALSADGKTLAVASSTGVYLYDAETLQLQARLDTGIEAFAAAFDPRESGWQLAA